MSPRTLRRREPRAASRDPHTLINANVHANSPNTITVQTTTTTTMKVNTDGIEGEGSRRNKDARTSAGGTKTSRTSAGRTSTGVPGSGEKRQRGLAEFGITRSPHPQGKKRTREVEEEDDGDILGLDRSKEIVLTYIQDREHTNTNTPKRRRISTTNLVNGSMCVDASREGNRERDVTVSMENSLPSPPAEDSEGDRPGNAIEVDTGTSSPSEEKRGRSASNGTSNASKHDEDEKDKERNIDEVVFGDLCFKSWYSSFYTKDLIGNGNGENHSQGVSQGSGKSGKSGKSTKSAKSCKGGSERESRSAKGLQVDRLFVCNWCFGYTVHGGEMARHRECCERRGSVPGNCVYEHEDGGEWSVWEVDGEVEGVSFDSFLPSFSLFQKHQKY